MKIIIKPSLTGKAGQLAEAELHFEGPPGEQAAADGILAGLKLIGFGIWEARPGSSGRTVTFPARSYSVNGERRSFALLRPVAFDYSQETLKLAILKAFDEQIVGETIRAIGQYAQGIEATIAPVAPEPAGE